MRDLKKILDFCRKYIGLHKRAILIYTLVAFVYHMLTLVEPYIFGSFVDKLGTNRTLAFILEYCGIYLMVCILNYLSSYYVKITGTKLNVDVCQDFKSDMLVHIQNTSLSYTNSIDKANFTHKINNDVQLLMGFVLNLLQTVFGRMASLVIPLIYILSKNLPLGLVTLAAFPVMLFVYKVFEKKLYITSGNYMNAQTDFFQKLEEQLFNVKYIKLNNASGILKKRFADSGERLKTTAVKDERVSFLYWLFSNNMDAFLKIFLFLYGGISILKGSMSVGTFIIITSYLPMTTTSFMYILDLGKEIQQAKVYYTRLKEIEDVKEEPNGTALLDHICKIELKNVNFSYDKRHVIHDFNYTFTKDHVYVLAGDNGKEKVHFA